MVVFVEIISQVSYPITGTPLQAPFKNLHVPTEPHELV